MIKLKNFLVIIVVIFLTSCGTLSEGFKSSKQNKSDEFLVEKKSPLVMPPDYEQLPEPQESVDKASFDEKSIKKLIKNQNRSNNSISSDSDLEVSIIEKIKDN